MKSVKPDDEKLGVYEAFKEAQVSDVTARRAAEAVAAYEARFSGIELQLERINARIRYLQWEITLILALMLPGGWLLLRVAAKVGAL